MTALAGFPKRSHLDTDLPGVIASYRSGQAVCLRDGRLIQSVKSCAIVPDFWQSLRLDATRGTGTHRKHPGDLPKIGGNQPRRTAKDETSRRIFSELIVDCLESRPDFAELPLTRLDRRCAGRSLAESRRGKKKCQPKRQNNCTATHQLLHSSRKRPGWINHLPAQLSHMLVAATAPPLRSAHFPQDGLVPAAVKNAHLEQLRLGSGESALKLSDWRKLRSQLDRFDRSRQSSAAKAVPAKPTPTAPPKYPMNARRLGSANKSLSDTRR